MRAHTSWRSPHRAFTLIELMVVISVIALLIGMLLPALASSRRSAHQVACLANLRSLELAHLSYLHDSGGEMLGTSHGRSWVEVLRSYEESLMLRSPVDESPHFPEGEPYEGEHRESSYAINYFLSPDNDEGIHRVEMVMSPSAVIHFVVKAYRGPGSVADHVHPNLWWSPIPEAIPGKAATEIQTNAHGGDPGAWSAVSAYGFLDGHAEARRFEQTYTDRTENSFNPDIAH